MNELKVMLTDDDETYNFICANLLRTGNFSTNIKAFTSAEEALNILKTYTPNEFPDCIFLDLDMPAMDGWDFMEEFNKLPVHCQRCNVFILTSSVSDADICRTVRYPAICELISKPLSVEKLKEIKELYFD